LVSHATAQGVRVQVAAARTMQLFEVMLGTHAEQVYLTYGDGHEPELLIKIPFDLCRRYRIGHLTCQQRMLRSLVCRNVATGIRASVPELTTMVPHREPQRWDL